MTIRMTRRHDDEPRHVPRAQRALLGRPARHPLPRPRAELSRARAALQPPRARPARARPAARRPRGRGVAQPARDRRARMRALQGRPGQGRAQLAPRAGRAGRCARQRRAGRLPRRPRAPRHGRRGRRPPCRACAHRIAFAPAPARGRLARLRSPAGPGLRRAHPRRDAARGARRAALHLRLHRQAQGRDADRRQPHGVAAQDRHGPHACRAAATC